MPELGRLQSELAALRAARDSADADVRALALRMEVLRARREALARARDANGAAAVERDMAAGTSAITERRNVLAETHARFDDRLREFVRLSPDDRIGALDDHVPFLFFPVRLETKFAHGRSGVTTLRVRIFPDVISVCTHDPLLSQNERDQGALYWSERARALGLGEEKRTVELAAWNALASAFGGPRARYVARQTRPADLSSSSSSANAPAPGADDPVRVSYLAAAPRARLLPDHFVVMALDADGKVVAEQPGLPIPDTLMLGPDPLASAAELMRDPNDRIAADPKLQWLFNFDRAVEVGMGVVLPVDRAHAHAGFHRIVAIGVKTSLDPVASAEAVRQLLVDHMYTDGVDLLPNGATTNNTDGAQSAFTTDRLADEALVAQEVLELKPVEVLDHAAKSDAQRLAEAFGLAPDAFFDWPSAPDGKDIADALAMNRALWPATWGVYLREMVAKRMPDVLKSEIERFFLTYVTGRTLLPSIRVGAQPYGVLATSDLTAWIEPRGEEGLREATAMSDLLAGLLWFRRKFEGVLIGSPWLQLGQGDDTVKTSMAVIGQLASSASFAARKGVTDEAAWATLNFENVIPGVLVDWWTNRERARDTAFEALDIDKNDLPLANLLWFDVADPLATPLVDRDPEIPLSETERIAPFDENRNYIQWLLTAPEQDLRRETFKDKDGVAVPAPKALLYRLLHTAWMGQLSQSAATMISRLRPELIATSLADASILNVGAHKVVPGGHATQFDAGKLGVAPSSRALGDVLLDFSRGGAGEPPPEALPLQSQRQALDHLADRPTAVLERAFCEHMDLASYRLDAWLTGLVSRRLDHMRRREGRARGLYIGAYGYVENLVPKPEPRAVTPRTLSTGLRSSGTVTEQAGNGGFVHAPSLNHAVTAAVLRNAYLTHVDQTHRDMMSVNLTSRRVRSAMSFIEGMRAGQDLSALLGYQFERGLHENHQGVELDQYIYIFRAKFPLVSKRLTDVQNNAPAETIEARNVVDGYDLIQFVRNKTYPYGIAGLPPAGQPRALFPQGNAIKDEIDRLEETLDAISDLLLAESVHQAVQSNIDRARGVIGALADGEAPPLPDVVQTPRSGRIFTERVALHLAATNGGWLSQPSPRARANQKLNAWLAQQLPAPNALGFEVRSAARSETVTLAGTGLDAIDLVLMSGDRCGDGSSQLERFLANHWRAANAIEDDVSTAFEGAPGPQRILFDLNSAPGVTPLAHILAHLRALRRLIGAARGLNAQDYRLAGDAEKADPANPKGLKLDASGDLDVLPARASAARDHLQTAGAALQAPLAALEPLYAGAIGDAATFDPAQWTAPLGDLRAALRALVLFGAAEALPRSAAGVNLNAALGLYEQGRAVLTAITKRIARADDALAPLAPGTPAPNALDEARRQAARLDQRFANLLAAAREALGSAMPIQPVFVFTSDARAEIEARLADPIEKDPLKIETWVASLVRVRPRINDLALVMAGAQFLSGSEPTATPVQLPLHAGDPWIGAAWASAPKDGEVMSVMAIDAPPSMSGDLEGLLLDAWTETVPTETETTGIAFHFDRPNATAPQALLLAAPPNPDGRWRWNELLGVIVDTFAQARLRTIDPDRLAAHSFFPVLPATMTPFTAGRRPGWTLLARDVALPGTSAANP